MNVWAGHSGGHSATNYATLGRIKKAPQKLGSHSNFWGAVPIAAPYPMLRIH